jgi:hypothetical protein
MNGKFKNAGLPYTRPLVLGFPKTCFRRIVCHRIIENSYTQVNDSPPAPAGRGIEERWVLGFDQFEQMGQLKLIRLKMRFG